MGGGRYPGTRPMWTARPTRHGPSTTPARTVANFRQGRAVQVSFGTTSATVTEGSAVTVTVQLNAQPGRELVIPLTAWSEDGAWSGDYSMPASVTLTRHPGPADLHLRGYRRRRR